MIEKMGDIGRIAIAIASFVPKLLRLQHLRVRACVRVPSPTLSPTDPVPRGLLTLCPGASSGPQGQ